MSIEEYVEQIQETFCAQIHHARIVTVAPERLAIYAPVVGSVAGPVVAVAGIVDSTHREFLFINHKLITLSCQVTFDDLSPADCIEYSFAEEPGRFHLAQVSLAAIADFRAKKFKLWEHQLKEPECEAAFRRILQQGPIHNVYDKFIFPNPESLAHLFKVTDEHSGKVVEVPHQVHSMRQWNPEKQQYDPIDATLAGAPKTQGEAKQYWTNTIQQLKQLRGEEYIDSLLK